MANLLIVDDSRHGAAALVPMLREAGHQAHCALSAVEAVNHLNQLKTARPAILPDLLLLDLTMIRPEGMALLDVLTREPRLMKLRVAFYSGRPEPEETNAPNPIFEPRKLGSCYVIASGLDWPQTYRRIQACLPTMVANATSAVEARLRPVADRSADAVRERPAPRQPIRAAGELVA